jgi:benzylsuccinate CoA-transferase BbsF subunit
VKQNALEGIRVLDFTQVWAGPYCTMLMACYGAEVIKVESEKRPDHSRLFSVTLAVKYEGKDTSPLYNNLNLGKRDITLDLTRPRAVELARELAKISDVVAENFRPGVMARLGLDYASLRELNPRIIYLSSSSRGGTGPEWDYAGYAPIFAALGGLSYVTGHADGLPSPISGRTDLIVGTTSLFAILAALIHRNATGAGQHIDVSSSEAMTALVGDTFMDYTMNGRNCMRQGNRDSAMAPHACYPCRGKDAWISIAVATDGEWRALCGAMGNPGLADDPRFADPCLRKANEAELDSLIGAWTAGFTAFALQEMLQQAGVAATISATSEDLFHDAHLRQRGAFIDVTHPNMGTQELIAPPWKLAGSEDAPVRYAPLFGEDNRYVFGELLGLSEGEFDELVREKVIF